MPTERLSDGTEREIVQATQCMDPVAVTTDGPWANAWCWQKKCGWSKRFIIPETGINIVRLQDEHNGEVVT